MDTSLVSSNEEIKEFLRPILLGLEEEDLNELARAASVRSLPEGAVICREGDPGSAVYTVVKGKVDIIKQLDDDKERHLGVRGPGSFFGEMAVLQEGTRTATVRSSEPTTLLEIDRDSFLNVLGRSPSLGIRLLVRMTARLRETDQKAIAELRQANRELVRALQQLEILDQAKADFIQVSAHELRTPVAALFGYAQMIQNTPAVQEISGLESLVQGLVDSTERLHRIFNNILDVSRVMSGDMNVYRTPLSISVILKGVASTFEKVLEERNLSLEMEGLQDLPLYLGDSDLLYKAFYHLINNGIKYTPDGGRIKVTGKNVEVSELGPCVEVIVEDNGIGIPSEDIDLIFEKFYQIGEVAFHSSGQTAFKGGGPGLGLTIARGAVEAHGGRIWAESPGYDEEECPGSRFIIQLPLPPSQRFVPPSQISVD